MGFLDVSNVFYREKKEETDRFGKCKVCVLYNRENKLCTKYNMFSELWQGCKSCKEKVNE